MTWWKRLHYRRKGLLGPAKSVMKKTLKRLHAEAHDLWSRWGAAHRV